MADSAITVLSLCSGIGMLDEGVCLGIEYLTGRRAVVVGYCERESYAASLLLARMADKALEPAPIFVGNFEDADWRMFAGAVDCVVAGFPCQPWSQAGKQAGTDDDRWLWPAIARLISEVEPSLIFLENVPGLVSGGGLELVLADLAAQFFDAEGCSLTAAEVGASHERERIFILAEHQSRGRGILRKSSGCGGLVGGGSEGMDDPDGTGQRERRRCGKGEFSNPSGFGMARPESQRLGETRRCDTEQPVRASGGVATWTTPTATERSGQGERNSALTLDVKLWQTPKAGEEDSGSGMNSRGEEKLKAQAMNWSTPQARDHKGENSPEHALVTGGQEAHGSVSELCGPFAPGPSDPRWGEIVRAEPWLAPATESGIRELATGQSVLVDESRADQLRCCGNQVVALQAACAFISLARRLKC